MCKTRKLNEITVSNQHLSVKCTGEKENECMLIVQHRRQESAKQTFTVPYARYPYSTLSSKQDL